MDDLHRLCFVYMTNGLNSVAVHLASARASFYLMLLYTHRTKAMFKGAYKNDFFDITFEGT